ATRQSLFYFRSALARSSEDHQRAHVLGRMAWIYHFDSNAQACVDTLRAALAELGRELPGDDALGLVLSTLGASLRRERFAVSSSPSAQRAETLCTLYIECSRVELESGHPVRAIAAIAQLALACREAAPSRTTVHAELTIAFMLSVLGLDSLWRERLLRAQTLALELGDPVAQTLCHQIQYMIVGWRGDIPECERHALECVVERGHFMELSELCSVCYGMYAIEQLRGRPEAAWTWLEHAIERVCTLGQAAASFEIVEDAAYATLQSLGREKQAQLLRKRLASVRRAQLQKTGFFHLLGFECRMQKLTESGEPGPEFEAAIVDFERFGVSSRQVHLAVLPYHVHVAHARVGQCLRAAPARWPALLPKLKSALKDLEAGERVPLIAAHVHVVRAAMHFLRNRLVDAESCLSEAQRLAEEQRCLWVSFAAARLRAHMLRAAGNEEAALDQARIAALWAEQSGQYSRLRLVREEFSIARQARQPRAYEGARRSLDALVHIGQLSSRELRPERQAHLVLGEVLEALKAERALLFMRDEPSHALTLRAARVAGFEPRGADAACDMELVQRVFSSGRATLCRTSWSGAGASAEASPSLVAPVLQRGEPVGVLYLDRAGADFTSEDAALLTQLANQVHLALELANALRVREQLENNLRRAHELEAVGRLVGGVAHDFNNVLSAIQLAADSLAYTSSSAAQRSDIADIARSAERGAELTSELMAFARGGQSEPQLVELNELLRKLHPTLLRFTALDVELDVQTDLTPSVVLADPHELERVLTNLCRNANDAMPVGGRLQVSVRPVSLAVDGRDGVREQLTPGQTYAVLSVSDTGMGVSDEAREHLFEPFFTTKPRGYGAGLGLSTVYAIVQNIDGHIDVASELGVGTIFRIYLPLAGTTSRRDRLS
ncbi:MAG TPA: ATP-binding protein, partial [Polyangiales bacterium]|nr:ATP-binding protein [Polyangiales bacterium]